MFYKQFDGHEISALGMGSLRLPEKKDDQGNIDRKEAQKIIDYAVAGGINYFDTAYTYLAGDSEGFLGEALSKYPRDSYYLATKFYAAAGKDIADVFEEQLRRCRTDPLTPNEQELLNKAAFLFMKDLGVPCSGCRYCCCVCPAELDIPLLMKVKILSAENKHFRDYN